MTFEPMDTYSHAPISLLCVCSKLAPFPEVTVIDSVTELTLTVV